MDRQLLTSADEPQPKIAHVLFMDVVGFTKIKKLRDQNLASSQLTDIVCKTAEYRQPGRIDPVICRSGGDSMALAFFDDPAAPARCAIEVTRYVRRQELKPLRMGLHSGPVVRRLDHHHQPDVIGDGINIAQRVMAGGDPNHILLSRQMAHNLIALGDWSDHISELGEIEIKDGSLLFVYNFFSDEFGNSNPPTKLVTKSATKPHLRATDSSPLAGEFKPEKPSTVTGIQKPGARPRSCGRCGMLLRDRVWCAHCGYEND